MHSLNLFVMDKVRDILQMKGNLIYTICITCTVYEF